MFIKFCVFYVIASVYDNMSDNGKDGSRLLKDPFFCMPGLLLYKLHVIPDSCSLQAKKYIVTRTMAFICVKMHAVLDPNSRDPTP